MRPLFLIFLVLPLTAISCVLPERVRSVLPATSEEELCKTHEGFFYSSVFEFCFKYPNDAWTRLDISQSYDYPGTTLTTWDFFTKPIDGRRYRIFKLFVTRTGEKNEEIFLEENITIAQNEPPYLIGFRVDPQVDVPDFVRDRQAEISEMLDSTKIFVELE